MPIKECVSQIRLFFNYNFFHHFILKINKTETMLMKLTPTYVKVGQLVFLSNIVIIINQRYLIKLKTSQELKDIMQEYTPTCDKTDQNIKSVYSELDEELKPTNKAK